jgi:excisionase family DNA binding protein
MKESLNQYLTVKELAEWVKLSESHIYFLVNKKKIPFAKIGGKLLFDSGKIKDWIESSSFENQNTKQEKQPKQKRKYTKKTISGAENFEGNVEIPEPQNTEPKPEPEPIQEPVPQPESEPESIPETEPNPGGDPMGDPDIIEAEDVINSPLD